MHKVAMLFCCVVLGSWLAAFAATAQSLGVIKGNVKDAETGEALPGLNVIIEGINRHRITFAP